MKKSHSPLTMVFLLAFIFVNQFQVDAQRSVRGNGNVTSETHEVDSFDELYLDGVCNIFIEQGNNEKVVVETDDNLHEYVYVRSSGGRLEIDTRDKTSIRRSKKMNIYVTIKDIKELKITGVGNVETRGTLKLNDLDVRVRGVGNVDLELDADELDADLNSVGNITFSGKINDAKITNSGVGRLEAYDLRVDKLDLDVSGVGATEVYVEKEISIRSTGVGNVKIKGDAVITDLHSSGIGKVKKM